MRIFVMLKENGIMKNSKNYQLLVELGRQSKIIINIRDKIREQYSGMLKKSRVLKEKTRKRKIKLGKIFDGNGWAGTIDLYKNIL